MPGRYADCGEGLLQRYLLTDRDVPMVRHDDEIELVPLRGWQPFHNTSKLRIAARMA